MSYNPAHSVVKKAALESLVINPKQQPTISLAGTSSALYDIPAGIMVPSEMSLYLKQSVAAVAAKLGILYNCPPINRINLKAGGATLYESSEADFLANVLAMSDNSQSDFESLPSHEAATTMATALDGSFGNSNALGTTIYPSTAALGNRLRDGSKQGIIVSTVDDTDTVATAMNVSGAFKLKHLGGFFGIDQPIYLPKMTLEVVYNPVDQWGIAATSFDPGDGAIVGGAAFATAVGADLDTRLIAKYDRNRGPTQDAIMEAARGEGYTIMYNYLQSRQTALGTSGSATMSLAPGLIVRAGNIFYNSTGSSATKLMSGQNLLGADVTIKTTLGSEQLQKGLLQTTDGSLRSTQSNVFRNSNMARTDNLRAFPAHFDVFENEDNLAVVYDFNSLSGKHLISSNDYVLTVSNASAATNVVQFVEYKYKLTVAGGVAMTGPVVA